MQVLHIIERLSLGGPTRALVALAKYTARRGAFDHSVAVLLPSNAQGVRVVEEAGVRVLGPMGAAELDQEIRNAGIVLIHFWNNPTLYELIGREWPEARVVVWCHVAGDRRPQILTSKVVRFSDVILATASATAELPVFRGAPDGVGTGVICAGADFERLGVAEVEGRGQRPRLQGPASPFTVGYLGAIDFLKIHPEFAAMHAGIPVDGMRVVVCGTGADGQRLRHQVGLLGAGGRFEFRGHVEDVGSALAEFDVFGYPLNPETWATAELALQEAMYAGVPPVVLSDGAPARIVQHEKTGLVAKGPEGYKRAIERLYRDPELRLELGGAAARHAREHFGAERMAREFVAVFERLKWRGKSGRVGVAAPAKASARPATASRHSGALRFIEALDWDGSPFAVSAGEGGEAATLETLLEADRVVAGSSALLSNGGAGGILHYRLHYPKDTHLRFWAGLVLQRQGRRALAAVEFQEALALGMDPVRVRKALGLE